MAKPRELGWILFRDDEFLDEDDLNYWMGGDKTEPKRLTSPAVEDPSSGGGERNIDAAPDPDSDLERLEKFLTLEEVWEMVEKLEKYHAKRQKKLQLYRGRRRGAKGGYKLIDILAIEVATHFFDNGWGHATQPARPQDLGAAPRHRAPRVPQEKRQDASAAVQDGAVAVAVVPSAQRLLQRRSASEVQVLVPPSGGESRR